MENQFFLEVCAYNFQSCLIAEKAGAGRIELCDNHHEGGTTPSFGTLSLAREKTSVQLYPIIRPRAGNFLYNQDEIAVMRNDIKMCKDLQCNGISVGVLTKNAEVDKELLKRIVEWAGPLKVTFHRAFDFTPDPYKAMEDIIEAGCERILTSGQEIVALDGLDVIAKLVRTAADRIVIMPGAGIRASNIERVIRKTGAKEYHSSARQKMKNEGVLRRSELMYLGHSYLTDADEVKDIMSIGTKTMKSRNAARG
jgi:copper homeostasis protein